MSVEANKSSDGLKTRKIFKTKQLALKYKRNADENRRRKIGVEPIPLNQYEYSTIVSSSKNDSRETPNFSIAMSKRDDTSDESSEERIKMPPVPIQSIKPPLLSTSTIETDIVYEEINHYSKGPAI